MFGGFFYAKLRSPLLLLVFILEELFELARVLNVRAAVRLWVQQAQPRPPAHLGAQSIVNSDKQVLKGEPSFFNLNPTCWLFWL